jgi:3',5'-cyclic AMP phosphodiesterase CpdA
MYAEGLARAGPYVMQLVRPRIINAIMNRRMLMEGLTRREFVNLVLAAGAASQIGCGGDDGNDPLRNATQSDAPDTSGLSLVARMAQLSDTHANDSLSPARFAVAAGLTRSAWRPYEAYSTQIVDGIVRTINRIHASGRTIDFVLHSGDMNDNDHGIELDWMLGVMDGRSVIPLSGPDDRGSSVPPLLLDPYAAYTAAGLYRNGVHGSRPSIPWYALPGNHDIYAMGLLAYQDVPFDGRIVQLPIVPGSDVILPTFLNPVDSYGYGAVTPAHPGPPDLGLRSYVAPNAARRYYSKQEFIRAMFSTTSGPSGHGFTSAEDGPSWYSVSPAPGLRMIGADTTDHLTRLTGIIYVDGCISEEQLDFIRGELQAAQTADEIVIFASHHPSGYLREFYGTAATPESLRALLNQYSNVAVHLCGHTHRNHVTDHGGYLEIETCATIDLPQEGRLLEIYRDNSTGKPVVAYEMFPHIDSIAPPLGDDPLDGLRRAAFAIATNESGGAARQKMFDESGADPRGGSDDRAGLWKAP